MPVRRLRGAGVLEVLREEARAAGHVEVRVGLHGPLEHLDLVRVVLAVAVDLDDAVVVVLERVAEPGLHRAADAEVVGKLHDGRAGLARALARGVRRTVVDDEHVEVGAALAQRPDDATDRGLLVVRGHDGQL